MDMASYLFRSFAAHGIVVAAVEHTDGTASATTLDDGSTLPFSPMKLSRREQLQRRADELLAAAQPGALGLSDGLSLRQVVLGGHSFGGPSALLAAASRAAAPDVHLRGVLLHDPALGMGEELWAIRRAASGRDTDVPTLSYVSDEYDRFGVRCGAATLHTVGGFHGNFPRLTPCPPSHCIQCAVPSDGCCTALQATLWTRRCGRRRG
jgi:pimeloyl-ACP methyl ester carboxylesterase